MKYRNPLIVILLSFVTFGIYSLVWCFKTTDELEEQGYSIPSAWLNLIPLVNYYWAWRFSEAVEEVTDGRNTAIVYFILLAVLGPIGQAIIQSEFNRVPAVMLPEDIKITVERVRG